ncbi:DUF4386 domain-containing protein [Ktedonospora formicarum]|uniref:DUF4386 domain-containing protein n=1 Tax=Ktedonospora formicarum TaxID=2778364 RepID=A0A8J3HWW5_9CHLR|nr:DUF4386 domain-containing protein [Ktedonospora formicarum]GHO42093.1 hypothetical protein KSX_02560 [Ktedonospora formicarum]
MNSDRTIARIAGALFLTGTITGLLPTFFIGSHLDGPDYLTSLSANGNQVMIGALFAFIAAVVSGSIAISLYPVLKKYNEALALASVGFRLIEAVFYIVNIISLLALLLLSQEFVKARVPGDSSFQLLGTLALAIRNWAGYVFGVSAFSLGALMYYVVLYQSQLIPRWLSGWGLIAATLTLAAALLMMFGEKPLSPLMIVLIVPIFLQEIVLAFWLIVKGFNAPAIASLSAKIVVTR